MPTSTTSFGKRPETGNSKACGWWIARRNYHGRVPHGLPGENFLYEHVHLNFDGNYQVARLLADQVAKSLPDTVPAGRRKSRGGASECARQLAWTEWAKQQTAVSLMIKIKDPPFPTQINHAKQYQNLKQQMEEHLAILRRPGAMDEPLAQCRTVAAASPDDWVLQEKLGGLLQDKGDNDGALTCWRRISKLLPLYSSGYCHAGLLLSRMGRYEEAIAEFNQYLSRMPDDIWAMEELGQRSAAGRLDEATREYQHILGIQPSFGEAHFHFGLLLMRQGKRAEAEAHFHKAVEFKPMRPDALIDLGEVCIKLGWNDDAVALLSEAVEIVPIDAITHLTLGRLLTSVGRLDEARQHCAEAVRLFPEGEEPHFDLGIVLARQNQVADAAEQFQEVLRINPNNGAAREQLAHLQLPVNR